MSVGAFFLGLAVGILTNQVFAMLTRALPSQWVRYKIRVGHPKVESEVGITTWKAPVRISSPTWYRRMLMLPLVEYLTVEVRLDNGKWFATKWDKGDTAESRLLADGVMTIDAIILTWAGAEWYILDKISGTDYVVKPQSKQVSIRVKRSLDNEIADMIYIPLSFIAYRQIELGSETHGGENAKT